VKRAGRLVIAIDGPSGSGKSTTARLLAKRLGYLYVDTGAMYRAVTLKVLRAGIDPGDSEGVARIAREAEVRLEPRPEGIRVLLDGEDVSDDIRTSEVTRHVSAVSEVPAAREVLVAAQRVLGAEGGVVLEGRDIGTVVFPDAEVKVWMVADLGTRAARRRLELAERGASPEEEVVAEDLARRDAHDSGRRHSPLKRAADAVTVDTTDLTIEEQVEAIVALVRGRLEQMNA
jgi:cytidylate kinase